MCDCVLEVALSGDDMGAGDDGLEYWVGVGVAAGGGAGFGGGVCVAVGELVGELGLDVGGEGGGGLESVGEVG